MKKRIATELLKKYKAGLCSEEECSIIESWYNSEGYIPNFNADAVKSDKEEVWNNINKKISKKTYKFWPLTSIAASFILITAFSFWFFKLKNKPVNSETAAYNQIQPGGNKAILKLSSGEKIILNDLATGDSLIQKGIKITKATDGKLIYIVENADENQPVNYNTISTPQGGTYQIVLPDGTAVWLNASSSLTYPTNFNGNERHVTLVGEAYFEVAHNPNKPFEVKTNKQVVTVLGTHFNISAYADDDFSKTTLYEGKVLVDAGNQSTILRPNEQATNTHGALEVKGVKNDSDIAWKNNAFSFNNEPLGEILKKLGRWYDVEFTCPKELQKLQFGGYIYRDKSLSQTLKIIEQEGTVNFKIEGRKITAMK